MFTRLTLRHLGPAAELVIPLDPRGRTDIRARSESGKSTIPLAILFALFGTDEEGRALDPALVRDGADRAEVRLVTGKGAQFGRTMTRTRSYTRLVAIPGEEPAKPASDAAMLALLPAVLTRDAELVRCILAPMAWRTLAESAGEGRRLRDLLSRLAPAGGDLRAEVARLMGEAKQELLDGDPDDPKAAEAQRSRANAAKDQAIGRLAEAQRAGVAVEAADGPTDDHVGAAGDVQAAYLAWRRHDAAAERIETARRARVEAQARHATWTERRDVLGKRPADDSERLRAASVALVGAREDDREARAAETRALGALVGWNRAAADAEASTTDADLDAARRAETGAAAVLARLEAAGDTCPTCARPGWEKAASALAEAVAAHDAAKDATAAAAKGAPKRKRAAVAAAEGGAKTANDIATRCARARETAAAALVAAETAHAEAIAAGAAAKSWDAAREMLDREPTIPTVPVDLAAPERPRPTDAQVAWADEVESAAVAARGAAQERERTARGAAAALDAAKLAATATAKEAARCAALVDAVRSAPSALAGRQLGALGDLGCVSISLVDGGGVDVRIDGRPWRCASRGRRVVADLCLRVGLRRAARMEWLPVVVDDVGAWTGAWPTVAGPSIWLWTVDEVFSSSAAPAAVAVAS